MSNISEEEIIEMLEDFIKKSNKEEDFIYYSEYKYCNETAGYVQGLLDLYNKEKEKNKLLIEGKFREVTGKNSYIKDNYISKDKITKRIEEIRKIFPNDVMFTREFLITELKGLEEENV